MKTLEDLIFVSAHPDVPYFIWQSEVYITNFLEKGIKPENIHCVFSEERNKPASEGFNRLKEKYKGVVFASYIRDIDNDMGYISSLRPNALKKHFLMYNLSDKIVFYHDSDIIFRELPDFESMLNDENWYLSDTNSYINSTYIREKCEEHIDVMSQIVGIDRNVPIQYDQHSGGAQYLMKKIDSKFWEKVEHDCLMFYDYFRMFEASERDLLNKTILSPEDYDKLSREGKRIYDSMLNVFKSYNPIQKWCSDMWAVLWNAWYFGNKTINSPELNFSWASSNIDQWEKNKIFHCAGILDDQKNYCFFKGDFINKSPFNYDFSYIKDDNITVKYVEAIKKVRI